MLSTIAVYSSGPVTPSMRNSPDESWWPSERHSRAVATSSSRPTSRSNSVSPVISTWRRDGVGDVGVDVERGRPGRPVAGALLAADRPPRERGAAQAQLLGPLAGQRQDRLAPAQGVRRRVGLQVAEHRQAEGLGVPERVAVVAGPGQALGPDRPALGPRAGLQHVEHRERAPPAAARRRPRSRRPRRPRTRRGRRAARCAARPSPCSRAAGERGRTWSCTAGSDRRDDQP